MRLAVVTPLDRPALISELAKTISPSLTVRSSSLVAPSWATDGRMQTGGTEMYCQMYSSGRPKSGCSPSSSQSWWTTNRNARCQDVKPGCEVGEGKGEERTSAEILLKSSSTRSGFKSS